MLLIFTCVVNKFTFCVLAVYYVTLEEIKYFLCFVIHTLIFIVQVYYGFFFQVSGQWYSLQLLQLK